MMQDSISRVALHRTPEGKRRHQNILGGGLLKGKYKNGDTPGRHFRDLHTTEMNGECLLLPFTPLGDKDLSDCSSNFDNSNL